MATRIRGKIVLRHSTLYSIIVIVALMTSGCCVVAGYGMKKAKEERLEREDKLHKKIDNIFDKVS